MIIIIIIIIIIASFGYGSLTCETHTKQLIFGAGTINNKKGIKYLNFIVYPPLIYFVSPHLRSSPRVPGPRLRWEFEGHNI